MRAGLLAWVTASGCLSLLFRRRGALLRGLGGGALLGLLLRGGLGGGTLLCLLLSGGLAGGAFGRGRT